MEKRRLKIGVFIDVFYPMIDGVVMVADHYARRLSQNHDVVLFAPKPRSKKDMVERPYQIIRCNRFQIPFTDYDLSLPYFDYAFKRALKKHNFDIIHVHSPFTMGSVGIKYGKKHKIPSVITLHSQYEIDFYERTKNKLITKSLMRKVVKNADLCNYRFTVNQAMVDVYHKYGVKNPIEIMPNGTEMTYLEDTYDLNPLREKHAIDQEKVLLFVGRIDVVKNIDFIIDVCAELSKKKYPYKMIFIGDGPTLKKTNSLVKEKGLDNVLFLGKITDRTLIKAYFKLADLFVFPSLYDTNSLVQIEAASQKTPTLFIRGSVTSSSVIENVNGFHAPNDVKLYAQKIMDIFANDTLYQEVSKNAFEQIYQSWDNIVENVEKRFLEIVENQS